MTVTASEGARSATEPLRPGQMCSRPIRLLRGILAPVLTDFAFRDLAPHGWADGDGEPAVTVLAHAGAFPPPGALIRDLVDPRTGAHILSVFEGEHGLQWRVDGVGTFWLDTTGWQVRYALEAGTPQADAESLLLGPLLGLAAQQRGEALLHASSVLVDGLEGPHGTERGVVAFSAPHAMGKSTLAASFIEDGLSLVSDDILPIRWTEHGPLAEPYYPRTKLRDDSLRVLRGNGAPEGEPAVSWVDKQRHRVGEGWGDVATQPAPLHTLYFLYPSPDPSQQTTFTPLSGLDAVLLLQATVYSPQTLRGTRAARALDAGTRLAQHIHVVRVTYHRDYDTLPALRAAILEHARGRRSAAAS